MKVIRASNFNDEMYSESFVTERVSETEATIIKRSLNSEASYDTCEVYYRIVKDDYKLYKFEA